MYFYICQKDVNRLDINKRVKKPGMVQTPISTWKVDTKGRLPHPAMKKEQGSMIYISSCRPGRATQGICLKIKNKNK